MSTYTDVGDDGMEAGDREPKRWVLRCWELRLERRRSRDGLARLVLDVMCRNSTGEVVDEFMAAVSAAVAAGGDAREMRGEDGALALRFEESWERVAMVDDSRREVDGGEKVEVITARTRLAARGSCSSSITYLDHLLYLITYLFPSPSLCAQSYWLPVS